MLRQTASEGVVGRGATRRTPQCKFVTDCGCARWITGRPRGAYAVDHLASPTRCDAVPTHQPFLSLIYVIEQQDESPWNKGALYNIGARVALADGFPCLVLHDVDLFPLDIANLYACAYQPRHMSASIDKFRYVLPYSNLVGGVCALQSEHYKRINGFSNRYIGWGGEDDDLTLRIQRHGLHVIR
ncbi:Beta-1,4-N-acetylgalactosaminyltransferase bre-4 [Eumeta japonica]|uniref:Beta-1,4-N-acetylgalactosaminyltransferase bre-4 n=1 Tax=Eumeta variegata TaxID=151549 RepID=A0A4C1VC16_EUMVA|nr:Beta-1,4-N-acetylgalactosaminyltransferase bre-4 [Eumeta japonica]